MKNEKKLLSPGRKKLFYILFSILAAFALWVNVTYSQNPDITQTVSGIQVEFANEESLTNRNMIVTDIDRETVSLRFTGKRNVINKLTEENVTVTVDLADITSTSAGVYQLSYTVNYPPNVNTSNVSVSSSAGYVAITVEKLISKTVEIRGGYSGDVAEGYQAAPMEFEPGTVTVSGPEPVVSQVEYAWVYLRSDNISATIEKETTFTLHDANDEEVAMDNLTFSEDTVRVRLPILMLKEVPLVVNFTDGTSAQAEDAIYRIEPASAITLSGDPAVLEDVNQIVLGTIDLTSFVSTTTETFPIVTPNGLENVSGNVTAQVTVELPGLSSTRLSATDIQLKNVPDGYAAEIITQSLDITLRGREELIGQVSSNNIRIVADLTEVSNSTGTFSVPARVYVDGFTEVDAIGSYFISVTVTRE